MPPVTLRPAVRPFAAPIARADAAAPRVSKQVWLTRVIDRAQRRLDFNLDTVADPKVVDRLIAAHRRGVNVRIALSADGAGSPTLRRAQERLEAAGIDVVARRR